MTEAELADHAERMRGRLEEKRHQIAGNKELRPRVRAQLLFQIQALSNRVNEVSEQCAVMRAQAARPEVPFSRADIHASQVSPT
jgi:hypothetical protein